MKVKRAHFDRKKFFQRKVKQCQKRRWSLLQLFEKIPIRSTEPKKSTISNFGHRKSSSSQKTKIFHGIFLGFLKNFRILMQSCCFFVFFSRPFHENSNFSKTVHTIFIKFCTVILHTKGALRAQRHQNRMAGM